MTERPHLASGKLRKQDGKWLIELDESTSGLAITGLEDKSDVRLVFWDSRPVGSRGEVEEIARVQQLEIEIIATGLAQEGALAGKKEEFLNRLRVEGEESKSSS